MSTARPLLYGEQVDQQIESNREPKPQREVVDHGIPEKSYENPFSEDTFLNKIFGEVLKEERDIIIILDDILGRRGTGKTVSSLKLASAMDQTDEGIIKSKTSLSAEEVRNAYSLQPQRSGLVLDEAEVGASNRQAMSKTNQALREIMSMGRVEQKYVIVNTPIKGFIDKDLQKLADVWISMVRRGMALVHYLKWEPYSKSLLTKKKQWMHFSDIEKGTDLRNVYNYLSREKKKRIAGEDATTFLTQEEHKEEIERIKRHIKKEKRDELVRSVLNNPEIKEKGVSQRMIAESIGVTQPTISEILKGES